MARSGFDFIKLIRDNKNGALKLFSTVVESGFELKSANMSVVCERSALFYKQEQTRLNCAVSLPI
jgi:hypothetical protein